MFEAVRRLIMPSKVDHEASEWSHQNKFTPDLWRLEQYQRQLIFIADDLMTGHKNHTIIDDHLPIHPGCYTQKDFYVWEKDLGDFSFPVPLEEEIKLFSRYNAEPARIKGELYAIPGIQFIELDTHKKNGVQFFRKRIPITVPYRHVKYSTSSTALPFERLPEISPDYTHTVSAWMYIGIQDYWKDLIGVDLGSKAVELYEHDTPKIWIKKYYKF